MPQFDRIYLIGYMGAGKTTLSRKLAMRLGWKFCDLDQLFEAKYKITVSNFFDQYGEVLFRKLERNILLETVHFRQTIIATGGGTPCFLDNMDWMNNSGLTIYMKISPEAATHRLTNSKKKRPLLMGKTNEELLDFVRKHLSGRESFYIHSHITVRSESCIVSELEILIKQKINNNNH